jgi:hypothetical protein
MRLDEVTLLGRALRLQSHAHEHNFSSTQNKIGAPKMFGRAMHKQFVRNP